MPVAGRMPYGEVPQGVRIFLPGFPRSPFPTTLPDPDMTTDTRQRLNLPAGWTDPSSLQHLQAMRRHAHRFPEAGWCEFRTAAHWGAFFESIGFKVKAGHEVIRPEYVRGRDAELAKAALKRAMTQGVSKDLLKAMEGYPALTAEWDTGRPGKTVAIRVELDALAIEEPDDPEHIPAREDFLSKHHGFMHACGHDGHQAVAAELGRFIVENKAHLSGRVRFVFQPAEEGSRGAFPMVQAGIFDDVDVILCAHIGVDLAPGTVVAAPEKFLSTTKIDFEFRGKPSHAGMQPQLGRNALLAAANAAINMMALPRHGEGMTRVNVGTLHAGEGRNVVPSHASMEVEVRGENGLINRELVHEAILRAEGAAMSFGVECRHSIAGEATDFVPDDSIAQLITVCAHRARYCDKVIPTHPYNGSDDITLMIKRVQERGGRAGYFMVGAALSEDHSHATIDFDEKYLLTLYDTYAQLLVALIGNWRS